ncbi:hypothetical protein K1T71_009007 [Dendrolimus kikuchii]|uniref:Uncharacterized protein n=1 Tax=Dendrolimus kikuchii TaxID=765133 RepID=A0ACC1CW22_9NEOP|nr:hypothetical protein K1T71_009007 [Dendrolimus kikuchii]
MGVISQILIQRTEEGIHRAGESVTGVVKYAIDEPTEYKDISLSLIGKGQCAWSRDGGSGEYRGNEEYINRKANILQKPKNVTIVVPAGCYEYPFQFILPKDIPPSFKDEFCEITYVIVLEFVKARLINSTKQFKVELSVYGNVKPTFTSPIIFGMEKSLLKPFSARRHIINLKVEVAKTILTPGDNINLNYVITNESAIAVKGVRIELLNKTKYTADCGETKYYEKVFKECTISQSSCESDSIVKSRAIVPTLAELYTIQHTKVISKEYFLKLTLELPIPYRNESAELEVVIGETCREDDIPPPYISEKEIKVLDK